MDALNPKVWAEMVEKFFGPKLGRRMNQTALLFMVLGAIGFGGQLFFKNFIGEVVWPFLTGLFGSPSSGISLDNIEAIIIVLAAAIVFFVAIFAGFLIVATKSFVRRVVPQGAIDRVAEFRSEGISILNDRPSDGDADLKRWKATWNT